MGLRLERSRRGDGKILGERHVSLFSVQHSPYGEDQSRVGGARLQIIPALNAYLPDTAGFAREVSLL